MKTPFEHHELDRMINDPDNYKWGIIYFNPRDSEMIARELLFFLAMEDV